MARNGNVIIVFDFETTGLDTRVCEPVQVAAVALDPRSLEILPGDAGRFKTTLMCPPDRAHLDTEDAGKALSFNKIPKADILEAPAQEVVWQAFTDWIRGFNRKKNVYAAPVPAGKNICGYDLPIFQRVCERWKMVGADGRQNVFSNYKMVDLEHLMFYWFENSSVLPNYKMDTLRKFFGMSTEGAHDAGVDTEQTAMLIQRFMRMHRNMAARVPAFRPKETSDGKNRKGVGV